MRRKLNHCKNEICRKTRYNKTILYFFTLFLNFEFMLKKFAAFSFSILFLIGCDNAGQKTTNADVSAAKTVNNSLVVSGHSQTQQAGNLNNAPQSTQTSETKTKWTQSGSPIDTSAFDREIERAQEKLKAKPEDKALKTVVAEAFLKRGAALTEVGQYASALGDYRHVLKYDADNADAKTWINKITEIYDSINRQAPEPGEEPPPLPFEKKN